MCLEKEFNFKEYILNTLLLSPSNEHSNRLVKLKR